MKIFLQYKLCADALPRARPHLLPAAEEVGEAGPSGSDIRLPGRARAASGAEPEAAAAVVEAGEGEEEEEKEKRRRGARRWGDGGGRSGREERGPGGGEAARRRPAPSSPSPQKSKHPGSPSHDTPAAPAVGADGSRPLPGA